MRFWLRSFSLLVVLMLSVGFLAPARVSAAEQPPMVGAETYVVMDVATGQVLVSRNADNRSYPASITKIMTLGLVLENVDFAAKREEVIVASDSAIDALIPRASKISLGRGEAATLQDLVYATMLESANDASNVLAEYVAGSIPNFAEMMNNKAAQLGLTGTHFTNPSGQPEDEHYTTARDMGLILRWALSVPGFREVFSAQEYNMGASNMQPAGRQFKNSNQLSKPETNYFCEGVVGSKTGYTDQARYTLASDVTRGDLDLICIVMGCSFNEMKYNSTNDLLNYCFENFRRVSLPATDIVTHSVPVYGGGEDALGQIDVYAEGEVSFLLHNSLDPSQARFEHAVPDKYILGQPFMPAAILTLGEVPQQDGAVMARVPLTWRGLEQIMAENTSLNSLSKLAENKPYLFWFGIMLPMAIVLLLVGRIVYVQQRRQRRRRRRLAAARAQMPIRLEERPVPAAMGRPNAPYRRPTTPQLRVARGNTVRQQPRRVGRAR